MEYCILVYAYEGAKRLIAEIIAGIEEEGVLHKVEYKPIAALEDLCMEAVENSAFGCGIGVYEDQAVLSLKNFKRGEYAFSVNGGSLSEYRLLGINAARAIKKLPFMFVG